MSTLTLWLRDTLERAARTFIAVLSVAIIGNQTNAYSVDFLKASAIGAATAAVTVVISAVASRFGSPADASFVKPPA